MTVGTLRLVLFDCDGTMVDSHAGIYDAIEKAWAIEGLEPPVASVARRVVGLPLDEAIARLAPDQDASGVDRLSRFFREAFATNRMDERLEEPLYPGLVEAMNLLDSENTLFGVATGKSARGLQATLTRHELMDRFVTFQTSDLVPGKPRPDMALRAMEQTGVEAARAVMIGDTSFDMEMARNAGIPAIGVSWGYHPVEELLGSGAATILDTFDALPAAVDDLIGAG